MFTTFVKKHHPLLLLIGDEDPLVPVEKVKCFKMVIEKVRSRCDLILYEGQKHTFYHYNAETKNIYYNKSVYEVDRFLISLGFLTGEPSIDPNN